ncbi:hypothetical protein HOG98_05105 [bacterium]|jgi:hypothetical protein|nr:hypothetical protein [bacterium]
MSKKVGNSLSDLNSVFETSENKRLLKKYIKKYPQAFENVLFKLNREKDLPESLSVDIPNSEEALKFKPFENKVFVSFVKKRKQEFNRRFNTLLQQMTEDLRNKPQLVRERSFSDQVFSADVNHQISDFLEEAY